MYLTPPKFSSVISDIPPNRLTQRPLGVNGHLQNHTVHGSGH